MLLEKKDSDQVEGLELGIHDPHARRVSKEIEDSPMLNGPSNASFDRPKKPI